MMIATCCGSEALASALKCEVAELICLNADYAGCADSKMKKLNFCRPAFLASEAVNYLAFKSRFTSDDMIGESNLTVVLLFPKSATASNSAIGVTNLDGSLFVGAS